MVPKLGLHTPQVWLKKTLGHRKKTWLFFAVWRKSEASRKALDKNICYDFVLLYFWLFQMAKWSHFRSQLFWHPKFMSKQSTCYLFPGVYSYTQSKFYQIKINLKNKVHYFSQLTLYKYLHEKKKTQFFLPQHSSKQFSE